MDYYEDKARRRSVEDLDVTCENQSLGCDWNSKLQYYEVKFLWKIDCYNQIFKIPIIHVFEVVLIQTWIQFLVSKTE